MKMNVSFEAVLIGVVSSNYVAKDGSKGMSHKISLEQNDSVGSLRCSRFVADAFASGAIQKYSRISCFGVYDTDYNYMTVEHIEQIKK